MGAVAAAIIQARAPDQVGAKTTNINIKAQALDLVWAADISVDANGCAIQGMGSVMSVANHLNLKRNNHRDRDGRHGDDRNMQPHDRDNRGDRGMQLGGWRRPPSLWGALQA